MALTKLESLSSHRIKDFLNEKAQEDVLTLSDGLFSYQSLSRDINLLSHPVCSGARAVEVFPDVHRVIARLKNWIRGTHTHVSAKHLNRYLAEFGYRSAAVQTTPKYDLRSSGDGLLHDLDCYIEAIGTCFKWIILFYYDKRNYHVRDHNF